MSEQNAEQAPLSRKVSMAQLREMFLAEAEEHRNPHYRHIYRRILRYLDGVGW